MRKDRENELKKQSRNKPLSDDIIKQLLEIPCALKGHRRSCLWPNSQYINRIKKWMERKGKTRIRHPLSEEQRKKISIRMMGENNPSKRPEVRKKISEIITGRKLSSEHCKKISLSKIGEKHPQWRGGLSLKGYGTDFNDRLKRKTRKRDNFICQLCANKENGKIHSIHHIDYDKKNNKIDNLITLCRNCHALTSHNRESWISFFCTYRSIKQKDFRIH